MVCSMEVIAQDKHTPLCVVSHNLINKLTVIIGSCQLLQEKTEQMGVGGEFSRRISIIESIAQGLADELKQHQCRLDTMARVALCGGRASVLDAMDDGC